MGLKSDLWGYLGVGSSYGWVVSGMKEVHITLKNQLLPPQCQFYRKILCCSLVVGVQLLLSWYLFHVVSQSTFLSLLAQFESIK